MNKGMNYDRLALICEYAQTAQRQLLEDSPEANIVRQMRYIKETISDIEQDLGVRV